ncbi:matrix-remodeling-associated protein 7 isoform X1 [Delphinus delphis]|uniref:Matrix-remodeling-associated protein 7 isoform X1 n=1 Tax=Tursiops truncatus TaxID=9739 RepID=A0A6J3QK26_TURTR|nr:matrix-remodeling-associated protein 7 isoform X1 [Tursiops truncatus]XP_059854652.1 matrix-remodeling-associated protein 7 isoform X1 [Delphinus delphis]
MEAPAELLAALPALATALALLLAWLLVRRGAAASPDPPEPAPPESAPPAEASGTPAPLDPCAAEPAAAPEGPGEPKPPDEPTPPDESAPPEESAAAPAEAEEQAAEERQEKELDGVEGPPLAGPEEDDGGEAFSFKYSPGKLRGNQYRKMMTKEELEEEQRVQKEQLAAIFKLMKDNKETFGEMSDGDVQDQLRLYDM